MKLGRKELFLLSSYCLVIFGAVIYFFFFRFAHAQFKTVNSSINEGEKALSHIQMVLANRDEIEQQYRDFEQKLSSSALTQNISTEILQDIKSKATATGLNVINVKPFSLRDEPSHAEFDFKLETEAEIKDFGHFLYNLDASPYIFTIKHAQISAQTRGEPLKIQILLSAVLTKE